MKNLKQVNRTFSNGAMDHAVSFIGGGWITKKGEPMLVNTFHHIPGVGLKTEQALWESGAMDWDSFLNKKLPALSPGRLSKLRPHVTESIEQKKIENFSWFEERLPANLLWRLFPDVRNNAAYLDIETTGMEWSGSEITTIALYDGREVKTYVQGENLENFPEDIENYGAIITYNGKCFDAPFIENYFGIALDTVHIDLRYILKSLGYSGGLKGCERAMGIDRGALAGVDGGFAILLWHDYKANGNPKALETLLAYNCEDVVNLEKLMVDAYNLKLRSTPFCVTCELPEPETPDVPFKADTATIDRLRPLQYQVGYW